MQPNLPGVSERALSWDKASNDPLNTLGFDMLIIYFRVPPTDLPSEENTVPGL